MKCHDDTIERLDPGSRSRTGGNDLEHSDHAHMPYQFECRANSEYNCETALERLLSLGIGRESGPYMTYVTPGDVIANEAHPMAAEDGVTGGQHGQLLHLSGWVNTESTISLGCAGALLAFLQRKRSSTFLPGDNNAASLFHIGTIEMFTLAGTMFVNADTLLSLQITSSECHPNAQQHGPASKNRTGGAKEGLSVYGLFHGLVKTPQGRS